ncbi:hypothetical protein JCM10450v2_004422 [Rhodotorula kratochvilovae]
MQVFYAEVNGTKCTLHSLPDPSLGPAPQPQPSLADRIVPPVLNYVRTTLKACGNARREPSQDPDKDHQHFVCSYFLPLGVPMDELKPSPNGPVIEIDFDAPLAVASSLLRATRNKPRAPRTPQKRTTAPAPSPSHTPSRLPFSGLSLPPFGQDSLRPSGLAASTPGQPRALRTKQRRATASQESDPAETSEATAGASERTDVSYTTPERAAAEVLASGFGRK